MPMEGMMSAADMAELQNAQGVDAAKLFLEQMIRHHEGAITMARNEIDSGSYPPRSSSPSASPSTSSARSTR